MNHGKSMLAALLTLFGFQCWKLFYKDPVWVTEAHSSLAFCKGSLFCLQLSEKSIISTAHLDKLIYIYKMSTPWCFCKYFIYHPNLWLCAWWYIIVPRVCGFMWCPCRTPDLYQLQVNNFFSTIWKASGGTVFPLFSCHNRSHCLRVTAMLSFWQASQATM